MGYSLDATDKDCYPDTTVLINKLGITDEAVLKDNESFITSTIAAELICQPLKREFDFDDYKAIHYELFSELYEWAGMVRTINLSKTTTVFAAPEQIEKLGTMIFDRLKKMNYFNGLSKSEYVMEIANLYSTLNMLHPFREGNGRAQRIFFMQLIQNNGYNIDYSELNSDFLMISSIQAASGVMDNLISFFDDNIH